MRKLLAAIFSMLVGMSSAQSQPSEDEVRAFHSVVQTGGAAAVERALKKNPALATAVGQNKFQAIHVLDYIDFSEILALLISYGADINAQNDYGHTLLHMLVDPEFVPIVLNSGADLEIRDKQGRTPLMSALTEPDSFEMVRALLAGGADPNVRDNKGQTVLGFAREHSDDPAIVDLLEEATASE